MSCVTWPHWLMGGISPPWLSRAFKVILIATTCEQPFDPACIDVSIKTQTKQTLLASIKNKCISPCIRLHMCLLLPYEQLVP